MARKEKDQCSENTNRRKAHESGNLTQSGPLDWNVDANYSGAIRNL